MRFRPAWFPRPARPRVWPVLLAVVAGLAAPGAAADPPARARVAVGPFEVAAGLAGVAPETLTHLLREYGAGGVRLEAVPAAGDLERVRKWYQARGGLPTAKDVELAPADFARLTAGTRFLLVPTVSRLGDDWTLTADLVDLRSGESRVKSVARKGGDAGQLSGLVRELWQAHDAPTARVLAGHDGQVPGLAFRPDGKVLASAGLDHTVRVWDVAGDKPPAVFKGHSHKVISVAYSPDGKLLASGSWDQTVRLWDGDTGADRGVLKGHTYFVEHVAFGADGTLASGSWDGTARLWDAAAKKELAVLVAHDGKPYGTVPTFGPAGTVVATAGGGCVRLWTVPGGKLVTTPKADRNHLGRVVFSADGRRLATASVVHTEPGWQVELWDGRTGESAGRLRGHISSVNGVAFRPDGSRLAAALQDGSVWLWDTTGSGQLKTTLRGHTSRVIAVAFSPDGRLLASASADGSVRLWDAGTGTERAVLRDQTSVASVVVFSPDGRYLAAAFWDGAVRVWDLAGPN